MDLAFAPSPRCALEVYRCLCPGLYGLRLEGELDIPTVERLDMELEIAVAEGCERILVDLTDLEFVDSVGLVALVRAQRASDASGHGLAFLRPSGQPARAIRRAGLEQQLHFLDGPEALRGRGGVETGAA